MSRLLHPVLIAVAICTACSNHDLRGSFTHSADGNTYLAIEDDNGGHCGPLTVDGKVWQHRIGEAGVIEPGHHTIACGTEIQFDIPRAVIYRFDYWRP